MSNEIYVVSLYWDNGEPYGDGYNDEKPIKAFYDIEAARTFCKLSGEYSVDKWRIVEPPYIEKYDVIKNEKYIECPIDEDWSYCDMEYEDSYCQVCQNQNWGIERDYSFEELRIHKVELDESK